MYDIIYIIICSCVRGCVLRATLGRRRTFLGLIGPSEFCTCSPFPGIRDWTSLLLVAVLLLRTLALNAP